MEIGVISQSSLRVKMRINRDNIYKRLSQDSTVKDLQVQVVLATWTGLELSSQKEFPQLWPGCLAHHYDWPENSQRGPSFWDPFFWRASLGQVPNILPFFLPKEFPSFFPNVSLFETLPFAKDQNKPHINQWVKYKTRNYF